MYHFGTKRDDLFEIDETELTSSVILGRGGYDILAISSADDYFFDRNSYGLMRGIEEIDFSGVAGDLSVSLNSRLVKQAKGDQLTLSFDNTGPAELSAPAISGGEVFLKGKGTVQLSSEIGNHVHLVDGSTLLVHGGSLSDTIIAGDGGMVLDGQAGDDLLIAGEGEGSDTIKFAAGFDTDTVLNFDVTEDVVALEGFNLTNLDDLLDNISDDNGDAIVDFGNGDQLILQGVAADQLSGANFTSDGVPLPEGPPVIEIAVGTGAAELNQMIADAEDGTTFVLQAGNHVFDASIVIARDNISIEGSGPDSVTVTFDFPDGTGGDGIIVRGDGDAYASTLPEGAVAGSTTLILRDGHGFTAGDAIYIQQPNTQAYLDANGWSNVSIDEAASRPFRESIHIIESVEGNTLTLATEIAYDLEAGSGRYYTMDVTSGVSLSGFSITYDLGETDKYDFTNHHSNFEGTSALLLENTSGISVSNIDFHDVASTALNLTSTIGAQVDDISIAGSHNKGGGGNGYGIELHEAFNNDLTNLEIFDMRHSVVLSAWHAEVDNLVEITATNRDINLHGSPDHGNTITVQSAILDYDVDETTSGGDSWSILSAGGTNHARTDMSANEVTFTTGIASNRNDTIKASDEGSLLDGGFGYDILIGGSSDDVLIGGTRRDTMTGGDGSDTFVLFMGDDLDTITDFDFSGSGGGDILIFSNNPDVTDVDDLRFTQDGDDLRIRYGSNSTVILKDTELTDVDPAQFQFDPLGLISSDDFLIA